MINSEELFDIGNPSVVELVKTLGVSSGVDGETNQFQSNGLEGTANVNLRGLGAGRNLVLLNGRRNVWSPYDVSEQRQLFVDINMIPAVALGRVELLKDGAAATYGSDAISGVVNFITRNDFEGFETAISHKEIDGSDGDQDLGLIWGHDFGSTHVMASFGYSTRNQLQVRDRDWAIQNYGTKGNARAYTGIGNPGSFMPLPGTTEADALITSSDRVTDANYLSTTGVVWTSLADPHCADFVVAHAQAVNLCRYNYAYFDNLIEEEERTNFFGTLTHDFANDMQLSVEVLYGENEVPEWHTSPSYPPQTLFDLSPVTGRIVPSYHPGHVAIAGVDRNGAEAGLGNDFEGYADASCSPTSRSDTSNCDALLFFGRPFGASGPSALGRREYETSRFVVGLDGTSEFMGSPIDFTTSLLWTEASAERVSPDTIAENWGLAIRRFGGKDCTGNTPGANECEFYNPFSNAIQSPQQKGTTGYVNLEFEAGLANSSELRSWLQEGVGSSADSKLTVLDLVATGQLDFNGMDVGWAAGVQSRTEDYTFKPFTGSDLSINPCKSMAENATWQEAGSVSTTKCDNGTSGDITDDYIGSGRFIFLAGATPFDGDQTINAIFGELALAPSEDLDVQISARYEDYGGNVGTSFDPKIAVRFQATDDLVVRGSASTTFRGPTLNQLGIRSTSLEFVGPTGTFKAVDTQGNPNLDPETAFTSNLGAIFSRDALLTGHDSFFASLDYWSFDFKDPIIKESFNSLIALSFDADGNLEAGSTYADRFTLASGSTSSGGIERISVNMINGPDIETTGLDLAAGYEFDVAEGRLGFGLQATQTLSYDVGASELGAGFDALGKLNDSVSYLRPIVETKASISAKYEQGTSTFNFLANHTGSYKDSSGTASALPREVGTHSTYDLHYNLSLENFSDDLAESALWVSIYNATDEDPPFARLDLNYDPYTHNPFGRIIKVGVRHKF